MYDFTIYWEYSVICICYAILTRPDKVSVIHSRNDHLLRLALLNFLYLFVYSVIYHHFLATTYVKVHLSSNLQVALNLSSDFSFVVWLQYLMFTSTLNKSEYPQCIIKFLRNDYSKKISHPECLKLRRKITKWWTRLNWFILNRTC